MYNKGSDGHAVPAWQARQTPEISARSQIPFHANEIMARSPDPDGGRIYQRLMTSLGAAPGVLGWGEPAVAQARAASGVARRE
jgi:hypothetical protein